MTNECVLDADLLKKYCSDNQCCSYVEIAKFLLAEGHNDFIIRECNCLYEFFIAVSNKKCIIYYNEEINKEYYNLIDKLPGDLMTIFSSILSNKNCLQEKEGSFFYEDFEELKSTDLEHKAIYLDVAKSLTKRLIISTKEDINNIYDPNIRLLTKHGISYKNVCEHWDEIKHD